MPMTSYNRNEMCNCRWGFTYQLTSLICNYTVPRKYGDDITTHVTTKIPNDKILTVTKTVSNIHILAQKGNLFLHHAKLQN